MTATAIQLQQVVAVAVDDTGRFICVSRGMAALLGRTPAEMNGQLAVEFLHPADRAMTAGIICRYVESGDPDIGAGLENRYQAADGTYVRLRWVDWLNVNGILTAHAVVADPDDAEQRLRAYIERLEDELAAAHSQLEDVRTQADMLAGGVAALKRSAATAA